MRRVKTYFLAGLIVILPAAVTVYALVVLSRFFDGLLSRTFYYVPAIGPLLAVIPGSGLVVTAVTVVGIGMVTTNVIGRRAVGYWDRFFLGVPLARGIYNSTKQIVDAFLAQGNSAFQQVVLIEYPRKGMYALGFLTGDMKGEVPERTRSELLAVFVPTTPNPTSGMLVFVPKSEVTRLDMPVDDGLKLIVSGGVYRPRASATAAVEQPKEADHASAVN
ncbi:MAG: hypothetical protein DDT37_00184 [Firmicutes bacterium]|nr:hypothetical protein [candidate division NPL-UPA2 bacterium]